MILSHSQIYVLPIDPNNISKSTVPYMQSCPWQNQ